MERRQNDKEEKKAKRIMKSILRQIIKFDEYKNCSKSSEIAQKITFLEIMIIVLVKCIKNIRNFHLKVIHIVCQQ